MKQQLKFPLLTSVMLLFLAACTAGTTAVPEPTAISGSSEPNNQQFTIEPGERFPASKYADLEIVTLLPRDGIPAIDNPNFLSVAEADEVYDPDELILGVSFNDEARAYSVPLLSNHEIVNDTVGGVKLAVTW